MRVYIALRMTTRLAERLDACCGARGLTRHDFIAHAVEREVSQIEARRARRAREAREAGQAPEPC